SNHRTTGSRASSAAPSRSSRARSMASISSAPTGPRQARYCARSGRSSAGASAGTGPSWSTSRQGTMSPPILARRMISTVEIMRRARIGGDIVPWRDVLHEGPVPALAPAELRPLRAQYLACLGPVGAEEIEAMLRARDERLGAALEAREPVVLWFE